MTMVDVQWFLAGLLVGAMFAALMKGSHK